MKPDRTMIALASEQQLRLFVNEGVGKGLVELDDLAREAFPDLESHSHYADRPGRGAGAGGVGRHGFEPHETERAQIRDRFAFYVAGVIDKAFTREGCDRLVIAAAPKMLGELRADLPEALHDKVVAELDKDLVKIPLQDLGRHLEGVIAL